MTVEVFRIAAETVIYRADDMSGTGAKLTGGRWNSPGAAVMYCASNIALATLETLSTLQLGPMPFNRYVVRIAIPDDVWARRSILSPLPSGWDAVPAGLASRNAGDAWIASGASALLMVPSVIVPDEQNILLNPSHADATRIVAATGRKWIYDPRFF